MGNTAMWDRARTAFIHYPASLRRAAGPLLALAPPQLLFGATYREQRKLIARARADGAFAREWQTRRLRERLASAAQHAPHYRRLARRLGLSAADVAALEPAALRGFPILTREELAAPPQEFVTEPLSRLDMVTTGGSSGVPLVFYLDRSRSPKEWAFVLDAWARIGFTPGDVRAVLRGVHLARVDRNPWEYNRPLRELRLSPFHLTDAWMAKYCELMRRHGVSFLHGYPSALAIFAAYVLRAGREDTARRIRGVIAISERLFGHQREVIARAFPQGRLTCTYALGERVAFGSEIPDSPDVYDIEPLHGITELVDERGEPLERPGQVGRIVSTGLLLGGTVFVRYDTGDRARLVAAPSAANGYRLRLAGIHGRRAQEFLLGADGQLISMTAINIHSPAYTRMAAFQFLQTVPGRAVLRVIPVQGAALEDVRPFVAEISRKIGRSMTFEIELVERLESSARGKTRFIDQRLDLGAAGLSPG
jgi:phenylacetate-coenzyme A ligase PaaK-like adenylate-forming protein